MAAAGFPSRYLNGPLPYVRRHIIINKMMSLNKTFPSFTLFINARDKFLLKCWHHNNFYNLGGKKMHSDVFFINLLFINFSLLYIMKTLLCVLVCVSSRCGCEKYLMLVVKCLS